MKILMLIDVFSFKPAGGAGRVMFETARRLRERGHQVRVICRRREDLPEEGTVKGVEFRTYKANPDSVVSQYVQARKHIQTYTRAFFDEINNQNDTIVHTHHPYPLWFIRSEIKTIRVPICYTYHSPWADEYLLRTCPEDYRRQSVPWMNGWLASGRNYIEHRSLSASHTIITLSQYMKQKKCENHNQKGKTRVIPGGVDPDRFHPVDTNQQRNIRKRLNIPENQFALLTVRSLTPRTGVDILLQAVKEPLDTHPNCSLYIGGSGPLRDTLCERSKEFGISNDVHFLGYLPDDELVSYYQACDVFVLPTQNLEGFGLVTLESLACETPVIATPVGGIPEVLDEFDERLLSDSRSTKDLQNRIQWSMNHPDQLREIGKKGRKYIEEQFTWDHHVDQLVETYQILLSNE